MQFSLSHINQLDQPAFVSICGGFFEHSPWIAERAWPRRPFASTAHLHESMCQVVMSSTIDEQLSLIRAHPDLVGRLARQGKLTAASTAEQAAAGLDALSPGDIAAFEQYNADYRARFGFPFVICARENKKAAILAAFPRRLEQTRELEISTTLTEIFKIAKLRLMDALTE